MINIKILIQLNVTIFTSQSVPTSLDVQTLILSILSEPSEQFQFLTLVYVRDYLTDLFPILELGTSAKVEKSLLKLKTNQLPDALNCSSSGWREAS